MNDGQWKLGLDLGGTGCRAVAIASTGDVLARVLERTPPARLEREAAVEFVASLIASLVTSMSLPRPPTSVGIGASGPIDTDGVIRNPDTLPAFTDLTLVADLRAQLQVPVVIENDAVAAAIAEQRTGAARGSTAFLHVTLGTGVGICTITPVGPFRGADGMHPEASHFTLGHDTAPCYCGRSTCFEQGASRTALQRAAADMLGLAPDDVGAIPLADRRARDGSAPAQEVFDRYGAVLADGLSTLVSIFRPPLVVLGGSAVRAYGSFQESLHRELKLHDTPVPTISCTTLDDFGGAIGAAHLIP